MSSPNQDRARVRLIISGRVQGVFFRASADDYARKLGVTGYARNLRDGTVEIVAEGSLSKLKLLKEWAHNPGVLDSPARRSPTAARVDHVDAEWDEFTDEFDSFRIA